MEENRIPIMKNSPQTRSLSLKAPNSALAKNRQLNIKASQELPPLRQAKDDQDMEIKNLIKKNLLIEKPKNYAKIQTHMREINSKIGNPAIPPERYHSSKILLEQLP